MIWRLATPPHPAEPLGLPHRRTAHTYRRSDGPPVREPPAGTTGRSDRGWRYGEDRQTKRAVVSIRATDDLGSECVALFGGRTGGDHHESVTLRFRARLDPDANAVVLDALGTDQHVTINIGLVTPRS